MQTSGGYLAYGGSYLSGGGLGGYFSDKAEQMSRAVGMTGEQAASVRESIETGVDPSLAYGRRLLRKAIGEQKAASASLGKTKNLLIGLAIAGALVAGGIWWMKK